MNTERQQREAAEEFAQRWEGRGYEKGDSHVYTEMTGKKYRIRLVISKPFVIFANDFLIRGNYGNSDIKSRQ